MQEHATSVAVDGPAPPVSAAAVARAAGVSSAAVSYVLNGKGGVSPETRRHIIHVANELGFRPRKSSQSTDPQRTRVIGLILPNIINPMFPALGPGRHFRRGRVRLRSVRRHHPGRSGGARPGHVDPREPQRGRHHPGRVTPGRRHRAPHPAGGPDSLRLPLAPGRLPRFRLCRDRRRRRGDDADAAHAQPRLHGDRHRDRAAVFHRFTGPRTGLRPHRRRRGDHHQRRPQDQHPGQQRGRPAGGRAAVLRGDTAAGRGVRERRTGHRRHGIRPGAGTADSRTTSPSPAATGSPTAGPGSST